MMELSKLIEDITINGDNSKYIDIIKREYPYLLGILKNPNMRFNPNSEIVGKIGKVLKEKTNNYCPCVLTRNDDTICPCKKMREEDECICGLYINKKNIKK